MPDPIPMQVKFSESERPRMERRQAQVMRPMGYMMSMIREISSRVTTCPKGGTPAPPSTPDLILETSYRLSISLMESQLQVEAPGRHAACRLRVGLGTRGLGLL